MAPLPPRVEMHAWLRFEDREYTNTEIQDFEGRSGRIYDRKVRRVQVLDFEELTMEMDQAVIDRLSMEHIRADGHVVFTSHAWRRLFRIRRQLIRKPLRRLCHHLIAFTIVGRSQAPEKVTTTNLYYLRSMNEGTDVAAGSAPRVDPEIAQGALVVEEGVLVDLAPVEAAQRAVHCARKDEQRFYEVYYMGGWSFRAATGCEQCNLLELEPKLYDSNVIEKTNSIVIRNSEETLMLAEESRSKMLLKQKDPMMSEKKVNTTLFDYTVLNQFSQDFETRFIPQTKLSAEQAFWSQNSVNSPKLAPSTRPTKVEVPKELPKVSMVNTSLKKLKHHHASFDVVIKERTTTTAITEGTWGFEHTKACFRDEIIPFVKALKDLFNSFDQFLVDELFEVQNVFHQIKQVVEQHCVESKTFEVKMIKVLNENERLLEQVISKDVVNIIVTSFVNNAYEPVHECERCLKLETELQKDFIKREIHDKLFKRYTTLEKHCISLEVDSQLNQEFQRDNSFSQQSVPSFDQLFAINELNAQSQEKDMVIKKLKERIKSLSGNMKEDKIKKELEKIETEKVLVITGLKDNLKELKGKVIVDEAVIPHPIEPELLKVDVAQLAPKLWNNRTAHSDYLKHTYEETATLREIVEQGRSLNPFNTS
uniref:Uncharacterized protein n=1 Tax=Tanacetum cinerariifolium TaxID=118510 RepID=A0A6L2LZI2_TANCI|nr:hypothetical protein [Tanacetum cinerariifolium]